MVMLPHRDVDYSSSYGYHHHRFPPHYDSHQTHQDYLPDDHDAVLSSSQSYMYATHDTSADYYYQPSYVQPDHPIQYAQQQQPQQNYSGGWVYCDEHTSQDDPMSHYCDPNGFYYNPNPVSYTIPQHAIPFPCPPSQSTPSSQNDDDQPVLVSSPMDIQAPYRFSDQSTDHDVYDTSAPAPASQSLSHYDWAKQRSSGHDPASPVGDSPPSQVVQQELVRSPPQPAPEPNNEAVVPPHMIVPSQQSLANALGQQSSGSSSPSGASSSDSSHSESSKGLPLPEGMAPSCYPVIYPREPAGPTPASFLAAQYIQSRQVNAQNYAATHTNVAYPYLKDDDFTYPAPTASWTRLVPTSRRMNPPPTKFHTGDGEPESKPDITRKIDKARPRREPSRRRRSRSKTPHSHTHESGTGERILHASSSTDTSGADTGTGTGTMASAEKKPSLACLFCRGRKIACGPPVPGGDGKTCNQCARRNLKCEYPLESRRGMRKRKSASRDISPNISPRVRTRPRTE